MKSNKFQNTDWYKTQQKPHKNSSAKEIKEQPAYSVDSLMDMIKHDFTINSQTVYSPTRDLTANNVGYRITTTSTTASHVNEFDFPNNDQIIEMQKQHAADMHSLKNLHKQEIDRITGDCKRNIEFLDKQKQYLTVLSYASLFVLKEQNNVLASLLMDKFPEFKEFVMSLKDNEKSELILASECEDIIKQFNDKFFMPNKKNTMF